MVFNVNQYTPISVYSLVAGMEICYGIYYERNGNYNLLCKDIVLTPEHIDKFYRFTAPSYNVFVPNEHFESFLQDSDRRKALAGSAPNPTSSPAPVPAPKPIPTARDVSKPTYINMPRPAPRPASSPVYEHYDDLRCDTADMLDVIQTEHIVPVETAEAITLTVHTQLETVEISAIIQSINSVRNTDEYLYTHCTNVALLNGLIGKWLNFDETELQTLIRIGLMHDIGKLKIPPEILNKPGKLTGEEFGVIKKHPVYSCEMLMKSGISDPNILNGVLQHHEKVNGLGYPRGLTMNDITKFARITSISDVYDAMVAARVYKEAHSPFQILSWFSEGCYSDLDISYVNTFLDCMTEELKGKTVLLSNGEKGIVIYVDPANFAFPIVKVGENVVNTSAELKCVSICSDT